MHKGGARDHHAPLHGVDACENKQTGSFVCCGFTTHYGACEQSANKRGMHLLAGTCTNYDVQRGVFLLIKVSEHVAVCHAQGGCFGVTKSKSQVAFTAHDQVTSSGSYSASLPMALSSRLVIHKCASKVWVWLHGELPKWSPRATGWSRIMKPQTGSLNHLQPEEEYDGDRR